MNHDLNPAQAAAHRLLQMPVFAELAAAAEEMGISLPESATNAELLRCQLLKQAENDPAAAVLVRRYGFTEADND